MRAVIYCRVSTKDQTANLSLPTQERFCREYCDREGFQVVRVFVEKGESAKTADRTELIQMLGFCRSVRPRIDVVVVYALSRFSRSVLHHHEVRNLLLANGTSLRSVTERIDVTSTGKFLESMLAAVAQLENDAKAERTIVGMKQANLRGRYTWPAPIGYLNTGSRSAASSLTVDPERAPLIRQAFELAAAGGKTKEDVLRTVTALGLRTKAGRDVSPQTFNALLANPVYAGRLRAWGEEHPGDWEPIISDALFVQTAHQFAAKPAIRKRRDHPEFPLRRFVRCGRCETPLTGSSSRGRTGRYPYYHCRKCGSVRTAKNVVEPAFAALLEQVQPKPTYLRLLRAIVTDCWQAQRTNAATLRRGLDQRIETLEADLDRLDRVFVFEREIDKASYTRQRDRLRDELTVAAIERDEAKLDELEVEGLLAFAEHVLGNLSALWIGADSADRRKLQEAVFPNGLVWDGEQFGTAVTISAFSWLRPVSSEESGMASPTGFEPVF